MGVSPQHQNSRAARVETWAFDAMNGVFDMETTAANLLAPSASPLQGSGTTNSFSELKSDDFLQLLVMQLRNQDPLEPMDNAQMLDQISSIREIELNTTLTESLQSLTGQQRFASASSLIGQHVTSVPGAGGVTQSGIVVGVRFSENGQPILQLADGSELAVAEVNTIETPLHAAEKLLGQGVVGLNRQDAGHPEVAEGVVSSVRMNEQGEIVLELDSGQVLRFRDVVGVMDAELV